MSGFFAQNKDRFSQMEGTSVSMELSRDPRYYAILKQISLLISRKIIKGLVEQNTNLLKRNGNLRAKDEENGRIGND